MAKFVIQPHGRLQEWIADEKGYFRDEGLDYEFRHACLWRARRKWRLRARLPKFGPGPSNPTKRRAATKASNQIFLVRVIGRSIRVRPSISAGCGVAPMWRHQVASWSRQIRQSPVPKTSRSEERRVGHEGNIRG